MEKHQQVQAQSAISIEVIISDVRACRDLNIKELLQESALMSFLEVHYDIFEISSVRKEFLKRDLIELKNSPLDLVHYSSLIKEIKDGMAAVGKDHPLFQQELCVIFKKYGF